MPAKNFNQIENEDYRINPTQLIVRKAVIQNGTSADDIFNRHNIEGTIIETLPHAMHGLGGKKPVACFVFRIEAAQMTTDEIAKKEAELKAKKVAQDKADAEAVKTSVASAPPPPPHMPSTQEPKDPDAEAKGTPRTPGTLPTKK